MACVNYSDCSMCEHGINLDDLCEGFDGCSPYCRDFACIHAENCERECISFEEEYCEVRRVM